MSSINKKETENNEKNVEGIDGQLSTTENEVDEVQEPEIKIKNVARVEVSVVNDESIVKKRGPVGMPDWR